MGGRTVNKTAEFVRDNIVSVLALLLTLVGAVYNTGLNRASIDANTALLSERYQTLERRLSTIEVQGSGVAREARLLVGQHEAEIASVKGKIENQTQAIAEMRADIRIVAEWVKEQKDKGARASAEARKMP
jgi:predicted urease superfamily metal-dependent hydrolase